MTLGPCQRPECDHPVDDHRVIGHTTQHFGACPSCDCPIAVFGITIAAMEAEQDRSRLTDPCQFCGTPVRTDTETDTSWPFEYPRREGNTTVSEVHTPERCVEVRRGEGR